MIEIQQQPIYNRVERRVFILHVTGAFTQIVVDIRSPAIIEQSSDRDIRVPNTATVVCYASIRCNFIINFIDLLSLCF